MKNITVLVSGSGSNLQRIIDCIDNGEIPNTKVNLVVADRDCYALERAENHQIPHQLIKRGKDFSKNLAKSIRLFLLETLINARFFIFILLLFIICCYNSPLLKEGCQNFFKILTGC